MPSSRQPSPLQADPAGTEDIMRPDQGRSPLPADPAGAEDIMRANRHETAGTS